MRVEGSQELFLFHSCFKGLDLINILPVTIENPSSPLCLSLRYKNERRPMKKEIEKT